MTKIQKKYRDAIKRAFLDGADYIVIYSRHQWFQTRSAIYGVSQGWLDVEFVELDEQSTEYRFRLTDKGRKEMMKRDYA